MAQVLNLNGEQVADEATSRTTPEKLRALADDMENGNLTLCHRFTLVGECNDSLMLAESDDQGLAHLVGLLEIAKTSVIAPNGGE